MWKDWKDLRKKKKAVISENVINGIEKKAASIGWTLEQAMQTMVERNWQGFNPTWITNETKGKQMKLIHKDDGVITAEYAIATLAAVAFAGLLVLVLRSDEVKVLLFQMIARALGLQ